MLLKELIPEHLFENTDFDYKAKLNDKEKETRKWAKSLVAFANEEGGTIYVGVNDDWTVFGLTREEADKTRLLVIKENDRHVFPHVRLSFSFIEVPNREDRFVLAIYVFKAESIVRYREGDFDETVYKRKDGASTEATPEEIVSMGRGRKGFDLQLTGSFFKEEDFSQYLSLAKEFRKDRQAPEFNDLVSEQVISDSGETTFGLSLFADSCIDSLTLVSCRLWRGFGKGEDEIIDKKFFKGPLGECFRFARSFIIRNTKTGVIKNQDGSRTNTYSYPELAIREVLVNAIAHRDYSMAGTQIDIDIFADRIEVKSPGGWLLSKKPSQYALDKIPSKRRNDSISACFELCGLMERSGTGFEKIANFYKAYPQLMPVLEDFGDFFCITLFDLQYEKTDFDEQGIDETPESGAEQLILRLCGESPKSRKELQEAAGIKSRSYFMRKVLQPMLEKGLIEAVSPKNSPNQRYRPKNGSGID